ncbi:DUF4192 family protein [Citricoccus sp. GCM10030269]|uniref:DUF4192 family protein n=1 Tax=Citricoccus sp. GCM10030269 TaxID=3273388 RepID=UPI003612A892
MPHNVRGEDVLPDPAAPITVRAVEPTDLISYINHTLGFAPRRSVAAIGLEGKNLGAVLRCDWDPPRLASWQDYCSYARQFAGYLTRDRRSDGCVVFLFRDGLEDHQDQPTGNSAGCPAGGADHMLAAALERELAVVGQPAVEIWLVTGERIWHLDCPDPASCRAHGSSAAGVETSALNATMIFEGSLVQPEPSGSGLPAAAASWSAELTRAVQDLLVESRDEWSRTAAMPRERTPSEAALRWFRAWEHVLAGGDVPAGPQERAFLVAGLAHVEWRDGLLAAASFTMDRALSGAAWLGSVPEAVADELGTPAREINAVLYSSVILARTRRAPDWQRISCLRAACTELLPHAAGGLASAVRCIAAWVEWSRGRGSAAGRIVAECRADDPEYSLAQLLEEILERGILSEWAGRRETAWSATGRSAR